MRHFDLFGDLKRYFKLFQIKYLLWESLAKAIQFELALASLGHHVRYAYMQSVCSQSSLSRSISAGAVREGVR